MFSHPHEAAQCAFRVAGGSIDQNAGHWRLLAIRDVDPFSERRRAVTAFECQTVNQQVSKRVEQYEPWTDQPIAKMPHFPQSVEPLYQGVDSRLHLGFCFPRAQSVFVKRQENSLSEHDISWQPIFVCSIQS